MASSASLKRLLVLARPEALRLTVGTFALLFTSGLSLAYPAFVKEMIDSVAAREPRVQPQGPVSLPPPTRGISPDLPPRRNEMMTSGGAAPDLPDGWANTPAAPSRRSQALWWLLMVGIGLGACALIVWLLVR